MGALLTALHHSRNWPPGADTDFVGVCVCVCVCVCAPDLGFAGGNNDIAADTDTDTDFVGACTPALKLIKLKQISQYNLSINPLKNPLKSKRRLLHLQDPIRTAL